MSSVEYGEDRVFAEIQKALDAHNRLAVEMIEDMDRAARSTSWLNLRSAQVVARLPERVQGWLLRLTHRYASLHTTLDGEQILLLRRMGYATMSRFVMQEADEDE